jgi:hypothetical protein
MRASLLVIVAILPATLGCATPQTYRGELAELCNTPGRHALAERITAKGGILVPAENTWDNSVDAATKEKMGPPLSKVVLPQDRFTAGEVTEAQNAFPEAQVSAPLTLDDVESDGSERAED